MPETPKKKITKIYLDTSVPNFVFADDAPEKMAIKKLVNQANQM